MSRVSDLHAAVLADLDDDAPRLVYADALQAAGDPRGELIVIQCELARLGYDRTRVALWGVPESLQRTMSVERRRNWIGDALVDSRAKAGRVDELRLRERALLDAHGGAWSAGVGAPFRFGRGFVEHAHAGSNPALAALFKRAPMLRSLELEVHDAPAPIRVPQLAQLRQLRVKTISTADCKRMLERLPALPHLRELAFTGLAGIGGGRPGYERTPWEGPALAKLAASPVMKQLEALDLYDQELDTPERVEAFLVAAKLRDLRLGMNFDLGGDAIGAVLERCPGAASLEILDLSSSGIGTGLARLARAKHLRNLRALRVRETDGLACFDDGAGAIGDGFPALRVLDLAKNPFARFLKALLGGRGLGQLTHLGLQDCQLDDSCARMLAGSSLLARLRVLDLRDNKIGDAGALKLAGAAPETIELIDLRGNKVSKGARDKLRKNNPDKRVLTGLRS